MLALESRTSAHRDVLRVYLAGEEPERRVAALAALREIEGPPLIFSEGDFHAASDAAAAAPDVVMALFGANEAEPLGYLEACAQRDPRPLLVAVLEDRSPALMRRVLHAGADELLFTPLAADAVTRLLMTVREGRWRRDRGQRGTIFSVASLSGGAGVTTLAGNLALAMNYALGKVTAVVDLDLQAGAQAVFLHLEPAQTIASLVEPARKLDLLSIQSGDGYVVDSRMVESTRKLDSLRLEGALCKHPSGVYLLAAPRRFEECDRVSDITVSAVLELMTQLFDCVIVDCGKRVDENAIAAWERSEAVLYVLDQSMAAAALARRFSELFARLGLRDSAPSYVLNRFDAQSPITEAALTRVLGAPPFARMPRADRVLERLQLRGQDLWQTAPHGPLARAVAELARRLADEHEPAAAGGGLLARWLGRFGAGATASRPALELPQT